MKLRCEVFMFPTVIWPQIPIGLFTVFEIVPTMQELDVN